jgi:hypothetical protein
MRYHEIIYETTEEQVDILTLAKFLANNIENFIKKVPYYKIFTIKDVSRILKIKIPTLYSKKIENLLINYTFELDDKIELGQHSSFIGRETSSYPGFISLNIKNLIDKHRLETGIAHEMQHAVDNFKSKGNNTKILNQDDLDSKDYINLPNEINARFTEVLIQLLKTKPNIEILEPVIILLFNQYDLSKDIFYNNYKSQQKYNRLLRRAYKFYIEVQKLPKIDKKTWVDKVKDLINKFKLA